MITVKFRRLVVASIVATAVAITSSSSYADNAGKLGALGPWVNPATGADRATPGFSDGLFGHHAVEAAEIGPFSRWQTVVARFATERKDASAYCEKVQLQPCPSVAWQQLVDTLRGSPPLERVRMVNSYFNHIRYVRAEINWGDPGYWETPFQFLARGGQCEDYAIAKYFALRSSGFSENSLRFVVVFDKIMETYHAITVVYLNGNLMALDNQLTKIVPVSTLRYRYVPYYSLNDLAWWPYASASQSAEIRRPTNTLTAFSTSIQIPRY